MQSQNAKTPEPKRQVVANAETQAQSQGEAALQLEDNRPVAVAQRKLQEMANTSPDANRRKVLQTMANERPQASQLRSASKPAHSASQSPVQRRENNTGLPDDLKEGVESLSGLSLDDLKVHRNSEKPAQLNAHAFAQGTDIHLGSGQERHLPHEAWHVVQQKQGRVKATTQLKGMVNVNDDPALESEADLMGEKALQLKALSAASRALNPVNTNTPLNIAQLQEIESAAAITTNLAWGLVKAIVAKEASKGSWSAIINPILRAGDTFLLHKVTSIAGLAAYGPVFNGLLIASKAALAAWDVLPANIKTSLLYVLGMATAGLPILSRYPALQDFVVKSDTGEVRATVQGWVDSVSSKISYLTQPLASLYSWAVGGTEQTETPDGLAQASPAEAEKLLNVNLKVITLIANDLKLGYENGSDPSAKREESTGEAETADTKGKPGLIVEFFVQLHLFGQDMPERGGQALDQLFFPFNGEFKYAAGSPIVINSKDRTLFGNTLGPVNIFPLEVSKSGVKTAGLNVSKLIIGDGIVILTDAKGQLDNKLVTLETKAELNIASYSISGSMNLQFDDGAFKSLELKDVNNDGNLKIKKFAIDNNYGGAAHVQLDKINLIKDTLSASNISASGSIENKVLKTFDFTMDNLSLDAFGSSVKVSGANLKYVGDDPGKNLEEKMAGGAAKVEATIGPGIHISLDDLAIDKSAGEGGKFEFSKGKIKFKDYDIEVSKARIVGGGIEISQAVLSLPEYDIRAEVQAFKWNSEGLDFKSLSVDLLGKTISPMEQVQLSNMSLTLHKDKGYSLTVLSDILLAPNNGPMVKATRAGLTMSKEEISGTLEELNISTSMFDVLIQKAKFSKDEIGAAQAGITFNSKEEDAGYAGLIPSFDTGLLDHLKLAKSLKATDVYFKKDKGFSIGAVYPAIDAFTIDLFGVQATVNPEERSITVKSEFTLPGTVPPFWPFSLSVPFPIFIGVAGHFGLELGGGVTLDFNATARKEKGKNMPYKFEAHPGIKGELHLKISAGLELGARLAVALQANLYAQAQVAFNTRADLTGSVVYTDGHLVPKDPLTMLYELKNTITAEVGGELKLKAFMFYDKQLTRVKFKDWNLGEWSKSGQIGSGADGQKTEQQVPGKFASDPAGPAMDHEIVEGKEAEQLLLDANARIIGSGAKRKEILSRLTLDVKTLSTSLLHKHQGLKRDFDSHMEQLMKIILRKDVYFRQNNDADDVQQKLDEFDKEFKLDEKRDLIRAKGETLDEYEAQLEKILGLMNDVETGLDIVSLEGGTGNRHEAITDAKTDANEIKEKSKEMVLPENSYGAMNQKLEQMGASALTVKVATSVMTASKFLEISTTKGIMGGENERIRIVPVDAALAKFDEVRAGSREAQVAALDQLLITIRKYTGHSFSSRTEAALLLQYQVENALNKLKK
jgi:hypothetical protein